MATGSATLGKHPDLSAAQVYLFAFTLGCTTGADFVASSMWASRAPISGGHSRLARGFSLEPHVLCRRGHRRQPGAAVYRAVRDTPLELSLARAVQGLGAGGLFTVSRIIIQLAAAREERRPLFLGFNAGGMDWVTVILLGMGVALIAVAQRALR
ncbi:hypothetical protein [Cupriavidus basilensis]|uniref:hypothetical protein n=1 Tax=Cupriavidus basilensis TaxID=68895 RepID=UPI0039F6E80F